MKKKILSLSLAAAILLLSAIRASAQSEITPNNSWLKLGVNLGTPVGDESHYSNFILGLDLKGQFLQTGHVGVGLTTGYNQYFGKDGYSGFGTIPAGAFIRIYPRSQGLFIGTDVGYSFLTGADGATGGAYIKPQLGYHNYSWNVFAYYNGIFRSTDNGGTISSVGIGASYNIRFHK